MDTKMITFLLVGVLVGAAVGVGIGYFVFGGDTDDRYDAGFNAGRNAGRDAGYNSGYDEGYDEGYDAGHDAATLSTYWFYIDFGKASTTSRASGWVTLASAESNVWISAEGTNVLDALMAALDDAGISYSITSTGWIAGIGDRSGDYDMDDFYTTGDYVLFGDDWFNWFWTSTDVSYGKWTEGSGLDVSYGTIFYVGFGYYEMDLNDYSYIVSSPDPNDDVDAGASWTTEGPFA